MSKIGQKLHEFYSDSTGQLSFGRLAATFCLFAVIAGYVVGACSVKLAEYSHKFADSAWMSALAFYNGSKLQQAISSFSSTPSSSDSPTPPPPSA